MWLGVRIFKTQFIDLLKRCQTTLRTGKRFLYLNDILTIDPFE